MVKVRTPCTLVGIKMLKIMSNMRTIVFIDYFTRLVFARCVRIKKLAKILELINGYMINLNLMQ